MIDDRDILERLEPLFPPPEHALEGYLRLRDRRRRNRKIGAITVAAVITAASVGSLLSSSFGSRRVPADTGIITPSNVSMLDVAWTAKTHWDPRPAGGGYPGITVADDTLYVATSDDAKLSAFPLDCGNEGDRCAASWTANIPVKLGSCGPVECIGTTPAGPAVSDGLVFVGSLWHLTAFPADCPVSSCPPAWVGRTEAIAHQAVVSDGVVYVGTGGGWLYAFPVDCERRCTPLWVSQRQSTSMVVSQVEDGVVYASTDMYWGDATPDAPGVTIGYAFPARCQRGCEPIWTAPLTTSDVAEVPLTASGGTVYVARPTGDGRSTLSANRASCGLAIRCRSWFAPLPAVATGPPIVVGGMVVVPIPGPDEVRAYPTACARRCEPLWSVAVPGLSSLRPVVADDLLFVGSATGGVVAIPLDCGTANCLPLPVSDRDAEEIAVGDGRLLVRSATGKVTALVPPAPSIDTSSADGRPSAAILSIGLLILAVGFILFARSRRERFGSL
jgi:outer membrane protein assembly factor BamB